MDSYNYDLLYDLLLKNSSTCEALINLNGEIYRYNDAYKDMVGFTDEEINGESHPHYVSEETYDDEVSQINELLSGSKTDTKFRSSRLTKNGDILQVEVTAIVFRDKTGNPKFILKRVEDITEKVILEEKDKSMQMYLQAVLDEIPTNIYFKDLESRFIMLSKNQILFLNEKSLNDVKGKTDFDFFHKDYATQCFKDEQDIIKTGKSITKEEREVHKDGTITWALTTKSPLKDIDGKIIGTYGISRNITDLKLAEEKIIQINKELELKNNQLVETIEELSKTQNKLIFAEKMAALGNLIGGIAHEINTPLGAIKASSSNIQEVVEKINIDLPWLINNASKEEIIWLFNLINEADAREISVFSKEERQKKRDLTTLFERNNIENAPVIADTIVSLRLNHSNEGFLELLSLPNSQHLLKVLKVLFSLKRNANNIFISVEKASKVVRALKNYIYKNSEGEFEATSMTETLETVLTLTSNMIKHSKTEIITHFKPIPLIFCRQDEMCQVWTNIITNAIQAMGEGGRLEIGTELIKDDLIRVWFKDNGNGIPENIKQRIFEPYFTTKEKGIGTGMGLDISKQIIESHHGKIYFESQQGFGTTFIIDIPINQENKQ